MITILFTFYKKRKTSARKPEHRTRLLFERLEDRTLFDAGTVVLASNLSVPDLCAENDSIDVPMTVQDSGYQVSAFSVTATHPRYPIGQDNGEPNFSNCPPPEPGFQFPNPGEFKLFDDGRTVIEAVRERESWRPSGMTIIVGSAVVDDVHFIRLYRRIDGTSEYPQVFVFYADGNMRIKPQPPQGRRDTFFGSSVNLGPGSPSQRAVADVASVRYDPAADSFEVGYRAGGGAILQLADVSRMTTRIHVTVDYPTPTFVAFATFQSMFVADGNADVDHVSWVDSSGKQQDDPILAFSGGAGSRFFFKRDVSSVHNTSAPDIVIGGFEVIDNGGKHRFLDQVYQDLLLRPADPSGLFAWSRFLTQGGTRQQVVLGIEASPEYRALVVTDVYQNRLGRAPEQDGLAAWVGFLGQGGTAEQMEALVLGSPEYATYARTASDQAFLQALYQDVLRRPLDRIGSQAWGQALASGATRADVALAVLRSLEADANEVERLYGRLLRRPADRAGLEAFVADLQNGVPTELVTVRITGSEEYCQRIGV